MRYLQSMLSLCMVVSLLIPIMVSQDDVWGQETGQIVLNYSFKKPSILSGFQEPYKLVVMSGLSNYGLPGKPILPLKTAQILIPYGEEVDEIQVITGDKSYLGKFYIQPGQAPLPIGDGDEEEMEPTPPDPLIYNSAKPYPEKPFPEISIQWKRGYQILILNLHPVEYIPKSKEVSYFNSFKVVVKTKATEVSEKSLFRGSSQDREIIVGMVDNTEEAETYLFRDPQHILTSSDSSQAEALVGWGIDKALVDMIDKYAADYYYDYWNLSLSQYKAWIALITLREAGYGRYAAHSQWGGKTEDLGQTGDRFDHVDAGNKFPFSTGVGAFQLDRGGGQENWSTTPTLDKLNPELTLLSVLRWHRDRFEHFTDVTLATFSENSVWLAVQPSNESDLAQTWEEITSHTWDTCKNTKLDVNFDPPTVTDPFEDSVRYLGKAYWYDWGDYYNTWLITPRDWVGNIVTEGGYYYTYRNGWETWIWNDPDHRFIYRYDRACDVTCFPEAILPGYVVSDDRAIGIAGETDEKALNPADILQYDYLIITSEELKNAPEPNFQTLAQWKESRGITTEIVTVEDIYASYDGADNQERIRNFIRDAYLNNGIEYVLLGGDADGADVGGESGDNVVPVRGLWAWDYETDPPNIPSDLYYACLDGSYDYDDDGIYGEPNDGIDGGEVDLMAEVYVGRAPVNSVEELSNFVTKTINYEQSIDDPYLKEVWMVGELLWEEGGGCFIEEAVDQGDVPDPKGVLNSLRTFRDRVLNEEYVRLYYEYSPDVTRILIQEPKLSIELAQLLVKYIPAIRYVAGDPNGKDVKVTQVDIDEAISFAEDLKDEIDKRQEKIGAPRAAQMVNFWEEFIEEASTSESKYFSEAFKTSVYSGMGGDDRLSGETWGGDYKDEINDGSCNYGYCTGGFPDTYNKHTLYDRDYPGNDWPKSEIINIINGGIHVINHLGHASVNYVMKMYNEDVDGLTNDKYFFGYSQGCYAGSFDNRDASYPYGQGDYLSYDCIAEHLVTNPTGAFAFVANSRFGWGEKGSTNGASQYYDRQFWDAVFGEHILNLGKANQDSKEDNIGYISSDVMRFCYYEINLLGDPETPLFDLRAQYGHDIAVTGLNIPWKTKPGISVVVQATVRNIGISDENDIKVQLLEDDMVKDTIAIETLPSGASQDVYFVWSSNVEGAYRLKVYAIPVTGEEYTDNNYKEDIIKVGRVILVDDDGEQCPNFDFASIQQAIDVASEGDTIKVYPGTYGRIVLINEGISLTGINWPVIDGKGEGNVVEIQADNVELQGFRVVNSGRDNKAGIWIECSHSQIRNNDIMSNQCGIALNAASNNNISNNSITGGEYGIFIESSCSNNDILSNNVTSNEYGIYGYSSSTTAAFSAVLPNKVSRSNFIDNTQNAYDNAGNIEWGGNYWDDYEGEDIDGDGIGDTPYQIKGGAGARDGHPATEPYLLNNSPITPFNPSPANGTAGVSIDADLSWTSGDPDAEDTVTYDVYFGTSSSPSLVSNDQSGSTYDPGTLAYNTKYYWKVVATDNRGASTTGPLWDFNTQTESGINAAPVADAGPDQPVFVIPPATTAIVTLDGSGSYDADGDPLTYNWTWDGNTACGVNATVELPLGTTTITLVVNDGKVDSEPDTVDIWVGVMIQLYRGVTIMLGYPGVDIDLPANLPDEAVMVWHQVTVDEATPEIPAGTWLHWIRGAPPQFNSLPRLVTGKAYLISATADCVWPVPAA